MTSNRLIKKEAPARRQRLDLKYTAATDAEVKSLLAIKALGDSLPEGYVAGWASTPDLDLYRHVVVPNAFSESIAEKGLTGPKAIKLLIQHDRDRVAGVIRVLETRGQSLWLEAEMNMRISYVRDFYEASKMAGGFSFSVGFYLEDYEFRVDAGKEEYLQINKGELEEISMVPFPGNPEAVMTYMKAAPDEGVYPTLAELEKALVAEGLVKSRNMAARLTRAVKLNYELFKPAPAELPPKSAPVAKAKLEALRTLIGEMKSLF